jgi:SAM-dependent methyltransferase
MTDVFKEIYASLYDKLYADKNDGAECNAIANSFASFGDGRISKILDLGCGTGRHAVELGARGFDVTGVDLSEAMLNRARERSYSGSGKVEFAQGDIRTYRSDAAFDAVLMNFNVLGYMYDNDDFIAALNTARANLRHGGLLIADFWYGPAVVADPPRERFREIVTGDTRLLRFSSGIHEPELQRIRVSIRVIDIQHRHVRADTEESHLVRYFFPLEFDLALRARGFVLSTIADYPNMTKPASAQDWLAAVVARAV